MGEIARGSWQPLSCLPRAGGVPAASGVIRASAEDFRVQEVLGLTPAGEGEHVLLHILKRHTNTQWLAREIARFAGVPEVDVGYAGLKDRRAETSQWLSVRLGGRAEPEWRGLDSELVRVLDHVRHDRKLRRGSLQGNRFRLRVRQLAGDPDDLSERLRRAAQAGVPNYFGEQRFGRAYGNLDRAEELFARRLSRVGRHKRGLYLSAVRSQLFNQVLGARLERDVWNRPVRGDLLSDAAGMSVALDEESPEQARKVRELELHPSGPLWGRGRMPVTGQAAEIEAQAVEPFPVWRNGLEHCGLRQERRPLRVAAGDLEWDLGRAGELELAFFLPPGSYATVLLREILEVRECSEDQSGDQREDLRNST